MSSVFVSLDGSWKIGGLEWACKFSEATQSHLATCGKWRSPATVAPEEKVNIFNFIRNNLSRNLYKFIKKFCGFCVCRNLARLELLNCTN